jgi:hypothetical protein
LANNTVPLSAAMGPSTLLPSHDYTTFHICPVARTLGIAVVAGSTGSGGAAFAFADSGPGNRERLGRILPRGKEDDGSEDEEFWAQTIAAAQPASTAKAICDSFLDPFRFDISIRIRAEAAVVAGLMRQNRRVC